MFLGNTLNDLIHFWYIVNKEALYRPLHSSDLPLHVGIGVEFTSINLGRFHSVHAWESATVSSERKLFCDPFLSADFVEVCGYPSDIRLHVQTWWVPQLQQHL